jgi:hypothetical protein
MPVVLCGCKTFSFTLREEHKPTVLENRVLGKTFGRNTKQITGSMEVYLKRKFMISPLHQIYIG